METYFGHIYIPKNNDFQNNEILINDDSLQYELIEGVHLFMEENEFWVEAAISLFGIEQYNFIKGVFTGLGYVTLMECNVAGTNNGIGGSKTKLRCNYVLTGMQINNNRDLAFSQLSITMPSLKKWFEKQLFNQLDIFEGNIKLNKHEPILLATLDLFTLEIGFAINQNLSRESGLKVNEFVILKIKAIKEDLMLWEFIEIYKRFKKFLAFTGRIEKGNDALTLYDKSIKYEKSDALQPFDFYLEPYNFIDKSISTIKEINYDFVKDNIEIILQNWYKTHDLKDSIDLVLEKYYQPKLSVETFFLNSCFAIEIYHRRFKKNERYSKGEFRKIKKEIFSSINDENVLTFFNEKLAHANEPSFRERLESMIDTLSMIIPKRLDTTTLIRDIVNTRNHIVHRSSSKNIINGLELYYTAHYLEVMTKFCVYKELGVTESQLNILFEYTKDQIESIYQLNKRLQTGIDKN